MKVAAAALPAIVSASGSTPKTIKTEEFMVQTVAEPDVLTSTARHINPCPLEMERLDICSSVTQEEAYTQGDRQFASKKKPEPHFLSVRMQGKKKLETFKTDGNSGDRFMLSDLK
ncbi:hypothetical protein Anapl_14607 [Anas platyrhynchos]|uniref:Uncharacterized protein n=1 Tax=Anas platyrhynchos TaxID=8839 RepID=R0LCL4_ANAPL|nr:hypothetical protein Anapl_14607 [Anas platyrhynchos]